MIDCIRELIGDVEGQIGVDDSYLGDFFSKKDLQVILLYLRMRLEYYVEDEVQG